MERFCRTSGEKFEISERDLRFYDQVSPVLAGEKFSIPPPTLCPDERQRRRLIFRNLRNLHHRVCGLTGKKIISCFPPDSGLTVYHTDAWWSDKWEGLDYGRDFDFNRPFFEQFAELYRAVPSYHLFVTHNENCEFVNGVANCRSCYLCFNIDHCEDCFYIANSAYNTSCVDCLGIRQCELCWECLDSSVCYACAYLNRCSGCSDSAFLSHCRNCRCCIACSNLAGKEYHVFNRPVSRAQFENWRVKLSGRAPLDEIKAAAEVHILSFPVKYFFGDSNESSTGDTLSHAKSSRHCFDSFELENCSYCNYVFHAHNCTDYNIFGDHSQWMYECLAAGMNCSRNIFCMGCWAGASGNGYCNLVTGCTDCFGCSGLRHKRYCIFNKEYGQQEYERLAARIIRHMQATGEWGEFFPAWMSPHALNTSVAQEYSPITRKDALMRGYRWDDSVAAGQPAPASVREAPESLAEAELQEAFRCTECRRAYKIIPQELRFYLQNRAACPARCPECRHRARLLRRPSYRLWSRKCGACGGAIQSPYGPGRPEQIYCDACYLSSVE